MNSKMGWMLVASRGNEIIFFPGKSEHRRVQEIVLTPDQAIASVVVVPDDARREPMATDFVWPTYESAMEADGEVAWSGVAVRVQAYFDDDGPCLCRSEGHFIADEIIPLVIVNKELAAKYELGMMR